MRENRLYGSEGGVAKAIPTPIRPCARKEALCIMRMTQTGYEAKKVPDVWTVPLTRSPAIKEHPIARQSWPRDGAALPRKPASPPIRVT